MGPDGSMTQKKRENNTYRRESSLGEVYGYRNRRDEHVEDASCKYIRYRSCVLCYVGK